MQNTDIVKCIKMAPYGDNFFGDNPKWLLLKDSWKDIFVLEILVYTYILHFLLWRHDKSEDFGEKCKHTELALNFTQKQYFS